MCVCVCVTVCACLVNVCVCVCVCVWVWIVEKKGKEMRDFEERVGVGGFCQRHSRHPMRL